MDPRRERRIRTLRVVIDRDLCVGFEDCMSGTPRAFDLDGEGVAVFAPSVDAVEREALLEACDACPVDALTVYEDGTRLVP